MDAQIPAAEIVLTPESYEVDIAGESVELPLVAINDTLAMSLLMVIDMGVQFGERVGRALAQRLAGKSPDIVVGTATLGIPVAIEVSRHLGLDQYVIVQKSRPAGRRRDCRHRCDPDGGARLAQRARARR